MTVAKTITARRRLELSQLKPSTLQREAMGDDVDISKFVLLLNGLAETNDMGDRITSASIDRTIEGASTLSVTVNDWDRSLIKALHSALDVQIDNLWFRFTAFDKQGDDLVLTFQDREIEILRTYHKWRIAQRGQMTRAEFVLSMLREVKEFTIPYVIPELHKIQPIERYSGDILGLDTTIQKGKGISKDINKLSPKDRFNHRQPVVASDPARLTVKSEVATSEQINNANIILSVGDTMGVSRRLKVIAIMVGITESRLINNPGGDADSAGVFQQRPSWGSYQDRTDVETSARLFYKAAIPVEKEHTNDAYWVIAADVQHPALEFQTRYALWRTEAERFVNAYGEVGTTVNDANNMGSQISAYGSTQGPFYFYRGIIQDKRGLKIRKPENTWSCMQRLADEVDWRAFFVSGTFYFISEDDLLKQLPSATIHEFDEGITSLDCSYDRHKKSGSVTITAEVGRWQVPPGSVVVLKNLGPLDGRWLVNEFSRDLTGSNREATITLKKPRPELPEPLASNATDINASWAPGAGNSKTAAPTSDLATQVLNNRNIHFSNVLESSDIKFGKIDDRVLQMLLWLASRGYVITLTALRSDHSNTTTEGRVSAHSVGKAVDIGAIGTTSCGDNSTTSDMMDLLTIYQPQLGFDQLIGPFPLKCLPKGWYDSQTLAEHRNHIHVGWPL